MVDITKLKGPERTKEEAKIRRSRFKIRPCKEFEEMKKNQRKVFKKRRDSDKQHRKKQDEETSQTKLE